MFWVDEFKNVAVFVFVWSRHVMTLSLLSRMLAFFFMCIYSCYSSLKNSDDKISLMCSKLPPPAIPSTNPPITPSFAFVFLSINGGRGQTSYNYIIPSSDSSCDFDHIPTSLLKTCFWIYSSNPSPLSSTCRCLKDISLLPSRECSGQIVTQKTQLTSR